MLKNILLTILTVVILTASEGMAESPSRLELERRLEVRGYFPTTKPIQKILTKRDTRRLTRIKEAVYDRRLTASLVAAIGLQETGHLPEAERNHAIGDNGDSVGRYQIQVSTILDVNAWYGTEFEPKDRKDPHLARIILRLYLHRQYWRIEDQLNVDKSCDELILLTPVQIARIWNGGTGYWDKPATDAYGLAIVHWLE